MYIPAVVDNRHTSLLATTGYSIVTYMVYHIATLAYMVYHTATLAYIFTT